MHTPQHETDSKLPLTWQGLRCVIQGICECGCACGVSLQAMIRGSSFFLQQMLGACISPAGTLLWHTECLCCTPKGEFIIQAANPGFHEVFPGDALALTPRPPY